MAAKDVRFGDDVRQKNGEWCQYFSKRGTYHFRS
jgi:hypothetical protein